MTRTISESGLSTKHQFAGYPFYSLVPAPKAAYPFWSAPILLKDHHIQVSTARCSEIQAGPYRGDGS